MGKWTDAFTRDRPSVLDREFGLEYTFGPPASAEELDRAERALGVRLPRDVREMLSEFNGVWVSSEAQREQGEAPGIFYLDVEHMAVEVPHYFRTSGNRLPAETDLRNVVFVCQENGFADLYGVCLDNVGRFRAGQVVKLDHDVGTFEKAFPNLLAFVSKGCRDWD